MMFVMVAMTVSAAFGLERGLDRLKIRSEAAEHVFDHVVGPNAKNADLEFPSANADSPDARQGASAVCDLHA